MQPFTLDERLLHIKEAKRILGTAIPWLSDTMENELKHALGDAPTSEFVIDPEGRVARRRAWGQIAALRRDLVELVGPVENPTRPEDLELKSIVPLRSAPGGIVKSIDRPRRMKPLYIEPQFDGTSEPFYVKLRPQADPSLLRTGTGKLFLDFRLDPIYHVHWNNLVAPIKVELESEGEVKVSPRTATGPQPEEPTDADPREFLLDVSDWDFGEPLTVTANYYACNDEQGWCKPVSQSYTILRAEDVEDGYHTNAMSHGGTWPQFRGVGGDGKSNAVAVPVHWAPDENIKWRVALPGPGDSSPVVAGDRVFITCAEDNGQRRTLYCFERSSGEKLWEQTVHYDEVMPTHKTNPYCASTPLAVGDRVVVWHGSAGLYCYDLDGNEQWSKHLGEFRHIWGYASSPVFFKDRIILNCGPGERTFVTAIDLTEGKTLWEAIEPGGDSGDPPEGAERGNWVGAWSTPVIAYVDRQPQIVCSMPTRVNAYDPESGRLIWFCKGLGNQPRADVVYTSPVIADGVGIAMGGYNGPAIGFRLGGDGDVTETNRLWRDEGPNPQRIGTGVIVGDHMYMANAGAGTIECLVARTGKQVWRTRIAGGNAWGSIVMAEARLYFTDQSGSTVVFAPSPDKYEEIAVNKLEEPSNSTPAIVDGQIFIRTFGHLYCIGQ